MAKIEETANSVVLEDGCYPEHDPTKSYCIHFKGRRAPYPRFLSVDDLVSIEEMADMLDVKRRYLADARYHDPALPFLRFGRRILVSKSQVAWWMNEVQDSQPDSYFLERRRRLAAGQKPPKGGQNRRVAVPKAAPPKPSDTN